MNELITQNVTLSNNGVLSIQLASGETMALSDFDKLDRTERRRIFKSMSLKNNDTLERHRSLESDIIFLSENPSLVTRDATQYGIATFLEVKGCLNSGELDNDTNRDEELEADKAYNKKMHHMIRYVSGISRKQQLLASVYRDRNNKVAYIRDDGTFVSLFDPKKFYSDAKMTGNDWCNMIDDIIDTYDVDDRDKTFVNLILDYFNSMSEQKMAQKYSLEDVVTSSDEIKKFFFDTEILYEINLFTKKYHQLDMQNANKPMNLWEAYNYYMTPHKDTDNYRERFLGTELLGYFKDKVGTAKFAKGKILSMRQTEADKKRVNKVIPVYMAYCVSRYCNTIEDLNEAVVMINRFSDWQNDKVNQYWTDMFELMVSDVKCEDMKKFYTDEYLEVYNNGKWTSVINTLITIGNAHRNIGSASAFANLYPKKFSTGAWFISNAIWFKYRNKRIGWVKIVNSIVDEYIKLLNGDVQHEYEDGTIEMVPVWKYFGSDSQTYRTNNAKARKDRLFQYVTKEVDRWIRGKKKDRSREAVLREASLSKHKLTLENNNQASILQLYPLSSDDLHKITFGEGDDRVEWIHPNDEENKADDGFLGLYDDNHHSDWKDKNWKIFGVNSQKDYWSKILERNISMIKDIEDASTKFQVTTSIEKLSVIIDCDLEVK